MKDLWVYVTEGGVSGGVLFVIWKYLIPLLRKLYQELLDLRKENQELKEKLAYLKGKYRDKVVLKSHGKPKNY